MDGGGSGGLGLSPFSRWSKLEAGPCRVVWKSCLVWLQTRSPTQLALSRAASPSETTAAKSLFLDSLPPLWPSTDVWFYKEEKGPQVEHSRSFLLPTQAPISCPSKVRIIFSGIFRNSASSHHFVQFTPKRELIPRILCQFRLNCFVFLEVCDMRLRKSPRFFVGWCFLWCIFLFIPVSLGRRFL